MSNKTTRRVCKFCNTEFTISKCLPYYSCSKCRKKEAYERSLVVKPCCRCGKIISAPSYTLICKSCAAHIKHQKLDKQKCTRCGKLFCSIDSETMCLHCRKDLAEKTSQCIFCGKTTSSKKSKLCDKCKTEGYRIPKKICVNCGTVFSNDETSWSSVAYCSEDCRHSWETAHCGYREKRYSDKEIRAKVTEVLRHNSNATTQDIVAELGINPGTLCRKGITVSAIRKELELPNLKYKSSIFENTIYSLLCELGVQVEREKTYEDLLYTRRLRYDFYLPKLNLLIEADGQQHYDDSIDPFNCKTLIRIRDSMKNEYAKANNINLLRIRYFRPHNKLKLKELKTLLLKLQCALLETGELKLFNCWNGGEELLPISSEACEMLQERSTTIPQGSTD